MAEPTEPIRQDIDQIRGSMTETLEQIEQRVRGTVDTTVQNVRETFDLKHQVSERPWLSLGLAVAAGYLLGSVGGNDHPEPAQPQRPGMAMRYYDDQGAQSRSPSSSPSYYGQNQGHGQTSGQGQGYTQYTGHEPQRQRQGGGMLAGLLGPMSGELDTLTHAAMRSLMSMVRESLQNSIPQFSNEYERVRAEHMARDAASEMYGTQSVPASTGSTGSTGSSSGSAGIYSQGTAGSSTVGTGSLGSSTVGTGSLGSPSYSSDASRSGRSDM